MFEGTRKPLKVWFQAMWELTSQKYGANALGLQRVLGLGSYTTAWAWLHKLRRAMVRPGRERLSGVVEVDESYLGGKEEGVRGRQTVDKALVAIAVELKDDGIGRIRLRLVHDLTAASLQSFVTDVVEHGSTVRTDGLPSYKGLGSLNFKHQIAVLSSTSDLAHVQMPSVHLVAALLKRWILGTFQGSVSKKHLPYYLDEFTFRFNRRSSKARGMLFYRLIEQACVVGHTTTRQLHAGAARRVGGVK